MLLRETVYLTQLLLIGIVRWFRFYEYRRALRNINKILFLRVAVSMYF